MNDKHAPSYYAASTTCIEYPRLSQSIEADVCVIGGGFTGINTAIELAIQGISVALVEANRIGWAATGRNGGQLLQGFGHDVEQFESKVGKDGVTRLEKLGLESVEITASRITQHNIECDLRWGYCDLANRPKDLKHLEQRLHMFEKHSYSKPYSLISNVEISDFIKSPAYHGGLLDMGSGHLHPLKLIQSEARIAAHMGVKIFEQSAVSALSKTRTGFQVTTSSGLIKASKVVIACNVQAGSVNTELGSKVLPVGSYIIATPPLTSKQRQALMPKELAYSDNLIAINYFRFSSDNRLLFGGAAEFLGRDPKNVEAFMRPKMLKIFPQLKDVPVDFAWGGMIGVGANRMPQIGQLKDCPDIYYAQAYSGHGVNATHAAARMLAGEITKGSDDFKLVSRIEHMKFPGGKHLRPYIVAAGMTWEHLKMLFR